MGNHLATPEKLSKKQKNIKGILIYLSCSHILLTLRPYCFLYNQKQLSRRPSIMPNIQPRLLWRSALVLLAGLYLCSNAQITVAEEGSKQNVEFPSFEQFVTRYKKSYVQGSEQYSRRKLIYQARVQKLHQMNNDPNIDYQVGVNHLSDLTEDERQSRKPLLIDENSRKQALQTPQKLAQTPAVSPTSLDWRQRGVVTSIKDQGECGSCWTFATAAYGQSRLIIKGNASKDIDLSEQYLLSCTDKCSCSGGYLQYVFDKAATGVPLESAYPYRPSFPQSPFICWASEKVYPGFIPIRKYSLSDSDMINLLQAGPVAISISAEKWQDYKSGVFRCASSDKVNHAVLLVGYTPDVWIVKNQWGADWGQSGYIRVTRNPLSNCKIGTSAFVMWEKQLTTLVLLLFLALVFL